MKVLYALANYPQASESYIEAEINYVRSVGVEVEAWSYMTGHGDEPPVRVHRCPFEQAIRLFKPDLIHVHYLVTAMDVLQRAPSEIPATVRAHSFDWSVHAAGRVSGLLQVRWIFAFPHFAREAAAAGLKKVLPMKVAYDAPLYDAPLEGELNPARVVRLAAGRRVKGLNDFMQVARLCKDVAKFELAVCSVPGDEMYLYGLNQEGARDGVTVRENLGRQDATRLIRTSGIYLDTSDPNGHPFGMPISIAEALASGAIVLARESKAAAEYLGAHGLLYRSVSEAAEMVKLSVSVNALRLPLDDQLEWARQFRSDVVLPALVEKWREILKGK